MIPNKALICPTSMYPYVNVIIYLGQVRTSEEDFSLPPVPFLFSFSIFPLPTCLMVWNRLTCSTIGVLSTSQGFHSLC